ncbi:hypothetical protein OPV22_023123 [Ensete ventricosum]|uniref:SKP1-like protein n=1 Tax=Ensete ventricosum TaxID=4639 RepID=A0AAV8QLD3_ENSVE|nr:hypothetical protein OPV22_023123 [Ensete ventricosum]
MASEDGKKMIQLVSSDDQELELEVEACMKSDMIKFILDDCNTDNAIPPPNLRSKTLAKVIEYMKKHAGEEQVADEEELRAWDGEFMKVDTVILYFLSNASNYLGIKELLDLCAETVANLMRQR